MGRDSSAIDHEDFVNTVKFSFWDWLTDPDRIEDARDSIKGEFDGEPLSVTDRVKGIFREFLGDLQGPPGDEPSEAWQMLRRYFPGDARISLPKVPDLVEYFGQEEPELWIETLLMVMGHTRTRRKPLGRF